MAERHSTGLRSLESVKAHGTLSTKVDDICLVAKDRSFRLLEADLLKLVRVQGSSAILERRSRLSDAGQI